MNKDIYLRGCVAQRLPILRRKNAANKAPRQCSGAKWRRGGVTRFDTQL